MITIATILGARPQFIKAAAISRAIANHNNSATNQFLPINEILIHTGQHYDYELSAVFFRELGLSDPAYHLGIGSGSHGFQTGQVLAELESPLIEIRPDLVIVYGDTNSTLAGGLTSAKLNIPVAHIEAGLRSFNRTMPEEINRILTDHLSSWLFCPSELAVKNLAKEGIRNGVSMVGDVMYDVCLWHHKRADRHLNLLSELGLESGGYALATVHRAGNVDDPKRLNSIFAGLERIAAEEIPIILPLHPRTKKALLSYGIAVKKIKTILPVSYEEMLVLEKNARVILTDSGGVQKEAYWLGIPCITLRDETEWPETVEAGWNVVVGSDQNLMMENVRRDSPTQNRLRLYGKGQTSTEIVQILAEYLLNS
jgi:UDP-N-acetylglucosamine 2-epimerase